MTGIVTAQEDFSLFLRETGLTREQLRDQRVELARDHSGRLYLAPSPIAGWGVFAMCAFKYGTLLCRVLSKGKFTVWGRYMNHAPGLDSNTRPMMVRDEMFFAASRDIAENEELTVDYRRVGQLIETEGGLS